MQIYNLIRGWTRPYVGAHTFYNGQEVKVWSSKLPECDISYDSDSSRPGMIVNKRNGALDVRTGSGYITLTEIDLDLGDAHVLGCMLGDMV